MGPVAFQDCQLLPQREIFESQLRLFVKAGFQKRKQQNQCFHHGSEACFLETLKSIVSMRTEFWQWTGNWEQFDQHRPGNDEMIAKKVEMMDQGITRALV